MIAQIQQIDGWEQLTANEIHSRLGALVLKPDSIYSFNQLVIAFDNVELAETLVGAMRAAGLNASADSLISRGLDFGLQGVQDNIDVLGQRFPGVFTPQWVAALKSLGNQTFFASVGGVGDVPTAEEIEAAIVHYELINAMEPKIQQANAAMRLAAEVAGATIDDVMTAGRGKLQ